MRYSVGPAVNDAAKQLASCCGYHVCNRKEAIRSWLGGSWDRVLHYASGDTVCSHLYQFLTLIVSIQSRIFCFFHAT
jgi:hypothetical protein